MLVGYDGWQIFVVAVRFGSGVMVGGMECIAWLGGVVVVPCLTVSSSRGGGRWSSLLGLRHWDGGVDERLVIEGHVAI